MRLVNLVAYAHPEGNRIDLSWSYPQSPAFPGVRVVRREGAYPTRPDDGPTVKDGEGIGLTSVTDRDLKSETVYYYTLFPFTSGPQAFDADTSNRVSATATGRYDFAGQMFELLPAIYHRYDQASVNIVSEGEPRGQLRRFLDLPGFQFDQLYSLARAALNLYDLDRVDGNLLPLLAQWIAWRTDFRLPFDTQRNELRFAPHLYQAIGLIATVEATVKRITTTEQREGWESRTKEFIHNIARTNEPERLRLMARQRDAGGVWQDGVTDVSINWAYGGRPTAFTEADGSVSFFYHTYRKHGFDIWTKHFAGGAVPGEPSQPVADQPGIDKGPTAAMLGTQPWVFWQNYDDTALGGSKWRLMFSTRNEKRVWAAAQALTFTDPDTESVTERQMPAATVDDAGNLWLFWVERIQRGPGQVKYNVFDGTKWLLANPAIMPPDGAADPRVEDDLIACAFPAAGNQRLALFWARREPDGPAGRTRWAVACRIKTDANPAAVDWTPVVLLPKPASPNVSRHDREPAPLLNGNNIEVFFSSNRGGSWSIFRSTLDTGALTFSALEQITFSEYAERAPLAVSTTGGTLVLFRSNESLKYTSQVYRAIETMDARFAGAGTVDTRDKVKMGLRGKLADFQTYTYDAGKNGVRTNDDRLARDTIGLYVTPAAGTLADEVDEGISRLQGVLAEFMPASSRAVFIKP